MKTFGLLLSLVFLIMPFSCSKKNVIQKFEESCLPSYVLMASLAEEPGKPAHPLLIRTDETDTTYYKYDVELTWENGEKLGYIVDKDYFRKFLISSEMISLMKEYIITHNTHINKTMWNGDYNTVKIVFEDQCDSLAYTVNKSDSGYFFKMIEFIKPEDEELRGHLSFFQYIQDRSPKWEERLHYK
jgi:hypothetical protein